MKVFSAVRFLIGNANRLIKVIKKNKKQKEICKPKNAVVHFNV